MQAPSELIEKIKNGIIKSGFPLEMKVGQILHKNGWAYTIGSLYKDFETEKIREIDLYALKTINGIAVNIEIACKKSTEKQLILYAPKLERKNMFYETYFTALPTITWNEEDKKKYSSKRIYSAFSNLDIFDSNIPVARKLIVSKGNNITEDNVKFLSDFNGLVKHSIITGSDGYIDTGFRIIYLYVMVFDGLIFNLIPSEEDFKLNQCEYGNLIYEPNLKFSTNESENILNDLIETSRKFKHRKFIIELMNPDFIERYLYRIETTLNKINKNHLTNWGEDWP